jgi:hypothetical protein
LTSWSALQLTKPLPSGSATSDHTYAGQIAMDL